MSVDNVQMPSGIDVRITGPAALVVALTLLVVTRSVLGRSRRGPPRRPRPRSVRSTGRYRIDT